MAGMGGGPFLDPEPALRLAKGPGMLNKYLIAICKAEGLSQHGVKLEMQNRISDRIRQYAGAGDVTRFDRIKKMLENPQQLQQSQEASRNAQFSSSPATPSPRAGLNYGGMNVSATVNGYGGRPGYNHFKPSPFYTIHQQIGETKVCEVMQHHRNTVGIPIKAIDSQILSNIAEDKVMRESYRVMVFCASNGGPLNQDISFPYQSEIKVNGGEIKANLKGLKNKPGSTRPADITDALRLKPGTYINNVDLTYALTTKKFYLSIFIVKRTLVADLVKKIESGKISKAMVLKEMESKAADPDIVTTSTVLSLKCPISAMRISIPCRSISCRHNQCFDAASYLQLQEQAPTWMCPECNMPAPFENLVVDEYVNEILSQTPSSVEQVTIEPDGKWSQTPRSNSTANGHGAKLGSGSDDGDLIEIDDVRVNALKKDSTPISSGFTRTPPASSREPSITSAPRSGFSSKRPISSIIDLTGSDDDDDYDEPIARAPKRPFTANGSGASQIVSFRHSTNGP